MRATFALLVLAVAGLWAVLASRHVPIAPSEASATATTVTESALQPHVDSTATAPPAFREPIADRSIRVTVRDTSGNPIRGAQVRAFDRVLRAYEPGDARLLGETDATGEIAIADIPTTARVLAASRRGYVAAMREVVAGAPGYEFALPTATECRVAVLDEDGRQVTNALVALSRLHITEFPRVSAEPGPIAETAIHTAMTDEHGQTSFFLADGVYTAFATSGWSCWLPPSSWTGFQMPCQSIVLRLQEAEGYAIAVPDNVLAFDSTIVGVAQLTYAYPALQKWRSDLQAKFPAARVGVTFVDRARYSTVKKHLAVHVVTQDRGRADFTAELRKCSQITEAAALPWGDWTPIETATVRVVAEGLEDVREDCKLSLRAVGLAFEFEHYELDLHEVKRVPRGTYRLFAPTEPFLAALCEQLRLVQVGAEGLTTVKLEWSGPWTRGTLRRDAPAMTDWQPVDVRLRHLQSGVLVRWHIPAGTASVSAWIGTGPYRCAVRSPGWEPTHPSFEFDAVHHEVVVRPSR